MNMKSLNYFLRAGYNVDWHLVTILFHLNVQSQQGKTEVVTILFQALP